MDGFRMKLIYLYSRYERFWHWFQAALIIVLLITGFQVNTGYGLFDFETAVNIHNYAGLTWLIAFAFFVFWMFTTGEWKQYIPTTKKMLAVIRYYAYGIFRGEAHPVPKRLDAKHNPLQRLTYLSLAAFLLPVQMMTGFLYWGYNSWAGWGLGGLALEVVALIHTACAFAILSFLIVHLYMTTTGHKITAHIKAMITGLGGSGSRRESGSLGGEGGRTKSLRLHEIFSEKMLNIRLYRVIDSVGAARSVLLLRNELMN